VTDGFSLNDLLCDVCLYKVESAHGEFPVLEMCKRCRKKVLESLNEIARTDTDAFDEVD